MTDDKNYIIDPLTAICKIALLHFMPDKTRLAINYHVLHIQEYNCYQWLERMKNGDSRIDIANLNTPLLKVVKWYILENNEKVNMDEMTNNSIRLIVKFAILGMIKLQQYTYHKDCAIKIILQHFINLLNDALNNTWVEDKYKETNFNINVLSSKIKNNYDSHIINSISKILNDANAQTNSIDDTAALVLCAHQLLLNRDTCFLNMMKEINTTL